MVDFPLPLRPSTAKIQGRPPRARSARFVPVCPPLIIFRTTKASTFRLCRLQRCWEWLNEIPIYQLSKMDIKAIGKLLGPRFDAVAGDGVRALNELGLPPDAAILDVGTGNGNFAIYLASQGFQVLTGEPSTDRSHYAGRDWALNAKKAGVLDKIR